MTNCQTKNYPVPAAELEVEHEIKKSRFIARVGYVESRAKALAMLEQARQDYPDARHHCWAYLLGDPANAASAAMSDDGEPSGTAGKPILNVLQHKGVGDVMLLVTRYFGGIKLGAGGLVRAYSSAAQLAMEQLPTRQFEAQWQVKLSCEFSQEQSIRHWLQTHHGVVLGCDYSQQVVLHLQLPLAQQQALQDFAAAQRCQLSKPE